MAVAAQNQPKNVLRLRLLGDLEVFRGEEPVDLPPSKRTRALLTYLALTGRPQRRERLCALLWQLPDDPRGALRWSLSKLRPIVDEPDQQRLVSDRKTVSLDIGDVEVDAIELQKLARGNLAEASLDELRHVADQIRGGFLEDLELNGADEFHAWLTAERREFALHQEKVLRALIGRLADAPDDATAYARMLVRLRREDQSAHAILIEALVAANRLDEARRSAEVARSWFAKTGEAMAPALVEALEAAENTPEAPASADPQVVSFPSPPGREGPAQKTPEPSAVTTPTRGGRPLVGRESVMQVFDGLIDAARSRGRGGTLLLHGEPGIGKSKLLRAFRQRADDTGALFFDTRSVWSEGRPTYWPWAELVHQCLDSLRDQGHDPDQQPYAKNLALLLPSEPDEPVEPGDQPNDASQHFRANEAVAQLLRHLAEDQPVCVAIDDVHTADTLSLNLAEYLAAKLRDAPVVLILTYSEAGKDRDESAERVLGKILREGGRDCPVKGLDAAHVKAVAESMLGHGVDEALAARLHSHSGGNPFYLEQLISALENRAGDEKEAEGAELELPQGMHSVIFDNLGKLSPECLELLRSASVLGESFRPAILASASQMDLDTVLALIEEASDASILKRSNVAGGHFDFAHTVVRDALYGELPAAQRAEFHERVGEAMIASEMTPGHPQAHQAAYHLLRARAKTRADRGVTFGLGASAALFHDFAYNKCAAMCRDVLDAMALLDADHPEQRIVMLRLGSALGRDGNMKDASEVFMSLSRMRSEGAAPSLHELDIEALRESYSVISGRFHSVVDALYDNLFSGHPEAKVLFVRKPMEKQLKMLADTFTSVIDRMENTPWLEGVLAELGVRHRHYGVTDEMYDWVADALFSALRDELGEHWTPRLEEVWRTAYYHISAMMIEAARAAEDAR